MILPEFDPLIIFGSSGIFVVITALILRLVYSSRKHSRQVHEPNLRLFMSHTWGENHQNHQNVMKICNYLRNGSYRIDKVWVDEEQMPPGSNIAEKIMEGVRDSNCFVVFITRDYIQRFLRRDDSDWCVYEMNLAVRHKLIIVPVLFDNSINPSETFPSPFDAFLRDFIAIDLREPLMMLADDLLSQEKCNEIINSAFTMLADKTIKMMQENAETVNYERKQNILKSGYEALQLCHSQLQEISSFEWKAKQTVQEKFKKEREELARREKEELRRLQVNVGSKKEAWSTKASRTKSWIRSIKFGRRLEEEEEEGKQEENNSHQILHKFLNLEQSQILNPTNEDILYALSDLIPHSSFTLVYRSNRNQPTPAAFHRCVDNIGPTVLLFKVDGIGLFGGYTSSNWHSVNELWDYVKDVNAFLFTLQPRMKFPIKLEKTSRAIFTSPYSVSFGKDLEFTHHGLLTHVRLQFPVNYQDITARGISNFCNPAQANNWLPIQVFEAWAVRPLQL